MSQVKTKVCRTCGVGKPISDFPMTTTLSRDGSKSWTYPRPDCIDCTRQLNREKNKRFHEKWKPVRVAYYLAHLDEHDYARGKTRARQKGATQFMSFDEWCELRSVRSCHWCGCELHESFRNVDHIQPLCWGGQHTRENCVMSCSNCNARREWERKSFRR